MEGPQEPPSTLNIDDEEISPTNHTVNGAVVQPSGAINSVARYKWWLRISVCTAFVLAGQAVATLLSSLYFNRGGSSKWLITLLQGAGFPLVIPFLFFDYSKKDKIPVENDMSTAEDHHQKKPASRLILVSFYLLVGIIWAGTGMMYTVGIAYLPVSTFSLITATNLAFNAFFSYFLNAQKFTPYIINSLLLLTISSILLVFQNDQPNSSPTSKRKYAIGFACTIAGSASIGFALAFTQFAFTRIIRNPTFRTVFLINTIQSAVGTCLVLIGLFASGEWKGLNEERMRYKTGTVSYVLNCAFVATAWQISNVGGISLIFEVSALFANVISTVGLPIIPVCAVIFFQDQMNGVKVISMILAIWGFASYIYQHYLDDQQLKAESSKDSVHEVSLAERAVNEVSLVERG